MLAAGPLHHLAIMTALTLRTVFRLALRQTEGLIGSIIRLLGLAIMTALTLRTVFRLALRQTEGLIGSIIRLLGLAIMTALTLRTVFRLALRQTEGLIGSIIRLLGLDLAVPDHSTLSRRAETLQVFPPPHAGTEPVHLLVDSTGLKLCGPGEWLIEKHGTRTRRSWRKLHIGVDAGTGQIMAAELSTNDVDDGSQVGPLLDQVTGPVASLTGDGAYDRDDVYGAVAERHPGAAVVVPPRATAVPSETANTAPTQRDRHLQQIAERGRLGWQKRSGYTRRALVEAAISRYKRVIGDALRSRTHHRQATEIAVAANALNRMLEFGRPRLVRIK